MNDISNNTNHNAQLRITDWSEADRPREKLRDKGAETLSDAELLAILIGSGSTKESAVALMQRILSACDNNLNTLGKMSLHELMQYNGIGEAKAITIIAACELGKRRQAAKAAERPDMGSAQAVYEYMHPKMQDLDTEEAWVLLMNHASDSSRRCDCRTADSPRRLSMCASFCARRCSPTPQRSR